MGHLETKIMNVDIIGNVQVTGAFRSINKNNPQPAKGQVMDIVVSVFGQSERIGICLWHGGEAMLEDCHGRAMAMVEASCLCNKNSFMVTAPCYIVIPCGKGRVVVEGEVMFLPSPEQQRIN